MRASTGSGDGVDVEGVGVGVDVDDGVGADAEADGDGDGEAAGDAEHGRGLAIVDAYTTAWGVHPLACGGKQVWFDYKPGRPA